jgi:menaquinone-dependent protoporphyrinogen oxidase
MKTLILYATKHGAAHEAAQRIAKHLDGAVLHDLKQGGVPSIAGYDCVIIGGSIYTDTIDDGKIAQFVAALIHL